MSSPRSSETLISLAIETTGRSGSVALLRGDALVRGYALDDRTRSAASLAPCIKQALEDCRLQGWKASFISVADGPGSFTGLRTAVTTAKLLAYAKSLPLVSVDSVAAVAASALSEHEQVTSLRVGLDAYRGQAFIGSFTRQSLLPDLDVLSSDWTAYPKTVRVAQSDELAKFLADAGEPEWLTGDAKVLQGAGPTRSLLARGSSGGDGVERVDAWGVGRLGIRSWMLGRTVDPFSLAPRYLRPSAAEEKAAGKSG